MALEYLKPIVQRIEATAETWSEKINPTSKSPQKLQSIYLYLYIYLTVLIPL